MTIPAKTGRPALIADRLYYIASSSIPHRYFEAIPFALLVTYRGGICGNLGSAGSM